MFNLKDKLVSLVGGLPKQVKDVRVSQTMRMDFSTGNDALGLWDPDSSSIVIRRDQLGSVSAFAATLLHEVAHARSGCSDVTRGFENELTEFLGQAAAGAVAASSEKAIPSGNARHPAVRRSVLIQFVSAAL